MKRWMTGILAAAVLLAAQAKPALAAQPYMFGDRDQWMGDSAAYAWAQQEIDDAIRYEFFTGYPRGTYELDLGDFFTSSQYGHFYPEAIGHRVTLTVTPEFKPGATITRAEFTTILARATGFSDSHTPGDSAKYTDVTRDAWYYPHLDALAARGVVRPADSSGGMFHPDEPITRLDIAVWSARAARAYGVKVTPAATNFADVAGIPAGVQDDIAAAVALGIVKGYPDGTFRAGATASRAEAAVMVMRMVRNFTLHLPTQDELMAAFQAKADAESIFLRDHGPYWQVMTADWSVLGKWNMPSILTWWYTPPGEPCTTQYNWEKRFACYESIASAPEGTADARFTLTPWYATVQVADIEPIEVTDRTARFQATFIAHPIPYDDNRSLSQQKETITVYMRKDAGRWKYAAEYGFKVLQIDWFPGYENMDSRIDGKTLADIP